VRGLVCRDTSMVVAECVDFLVSRDLSRVRAWTWFVVVFLGLLPSCVLFPVVRGLGLSWYFGVYC